MKVEDLGIIEEDVYDIETENHMFFANDILVHNSVYIELNDVLKKFYEEHPDGSYNEATDYMDSFAKRVENECLNPLFAKMKVELNSSPDCTMGMDREAISIPFKETGHSAIWLAKKHYAVLLSDMEGLRYEHPKLKIMGLYSVKSDCPAFVKPYYNKVITDLIQYGVDEARKTVKEFKEIFYKKSIEEIGFPKSVTDVKRFTMASGLPYDGKWFDEGLGKERNGGVPVNSKAAIYHNYLVKKLKLEKSYMMIKDGDRLKFCYLKENPYGFSVIGFHEELPKEFGLDEYVDYDVHYEKIFRKPISDIFEACSLSMEKTTSLDDFF